MEPDEDLDTILSACRGHRGVIVERTEDCARVIVPAADMKITVTIPRDVLEWFIDVQCPVTGKELTSDWADHYATDGETDEELRDERREEILSFLATLLEQPLRLVTERTRRLFFLGTRLRYFVEVQQDGAWRPLVPFWPPAW